MGQSQSSQERYDILNKGNFYKREFLKEQWSGTDRDGYRYKVEYSPSDRATCRECKQKIGRDALRIGRMTPSPFDAEAGTADLTYYYHEAHAWGAFMRSKCTSKVPLTAKDLEGFSELKPEDKKIVRSSLSAFADGWKAKCKRNSVRA